MRLTNQVRSFLIDRDYYVDIYENKIHVFHYIDILKLHDEEIILQMENFKIRFKGTEFRVQKLVNGEILVSGKLLEMSFIYE